MKYFKRDNFSKAILNGLVLKLQSICQWKASMLSILFHISSWVKLKCDSWHPDQDHSSPSSNIPCHAPAWYLQPRVIANLFQRSPNFENTLLNTLSLVRGRDINTVGGEHLHHNWAGAPQRRTHGQGWYYFVAITKFCDLGCSPNGSLLLFYFHLILWWTVNWTLDSQLHFICYLWHSQDCCRWQGSWIKVGTSHLYKPQDYFITSFHVITTEQNWDISMIASRHHRCGWSGFFSFS